MEDYSIEFTLEPQQEIPVELTLGEQTLIDADLSLGVIVEDKHFVFEQEIPSDTWQITHNLEKRPSVTVVDSAGNMQMPDEVTYNDDNTITIKFVGSFAGKAFLN